MKKWRKTAAAVLAAAMLCTIAACSGSPQQVEDSIVTSSSVSSETASESSSSALTEPESAQEPESSQIAQATEEDSSVQAPAAPEDSQPPVETESSESALTEGTVSSPSYNEPAAATPVVQEEEMRAVWVPFLSLDMTKETDKSYTAFQKKFNDIIAKAKASGANTLVVHVRSHGDAYYPSSYYPWTHFLSGTQGVGPGYDPLAYMVSATHQAGLKFHAWFNPLRIKAGNYPPVVASNSPYNLWKSDPTKANWTFTHNGSIYMNPGYSGVRDYIVNGIKEVVQKYDVDGVQFDDYFYPFNVNSTDVTLDQAAYQQSGSTLSIGAWRTQNINSLVSSVYKMIKETKPNVVFGISPQGNITNDLNAGADVYTWCSQPGYIDYICPQIYWTYDHPTAPFETLAKKWKSLVTADNVKMYIGLALYKAGTDSNGWEKADNIIAQQIQTTRSLDCDGFMLYSWAYLDNPQTAKEMANVKKLLNG